MATIHGAYWWWNYFKQILFNFNIFTKGSLVLSYGTYEIMVPTDPLIVPDEVYFSCHDDQQTVCQGDVSKVGHTLLDNGFILYADIKSNSTVVSYIIQYHPADNA